MPYDDNDNFISEQFESNDYSVRSIYSSDLFSSDELFLFENERGGLFSSGSEIREDQVDNSDYSDYFRSIDTSCSVLTEQVSTLSTQLDVVNNNIVVLNDNIKFCCGLVFTITFIVFIRTIFSVFNKVLGLNQA